MRRLCAERTINKARRYGDARKTKTEPSQRSAPIPGQERAGRSTQRKVGDEAIRYVQSCKNASEHRDKWCERYKRHQVYLEMFVDICIQCDMIQHLLSSGRERDRWSWRVSIIRTVQDKYDIININVTVYPHIHCERSGGDGNQTQEGLLKNRGNKGEICIQKAKIQKIQEWEREPQDVWV
jgi:hypothetical protein